MAVDIRGVDQLHSHHSLMGLTNTSSDLLPGTLELLILKALMGEARHGYGIGEHLRLTSDEALRVGESDRMVGVIQRVLSTT
jgi:hypothetical protein